jgi:hypothetical protein
MSLLSCVAEEYGEETDMQPLLDRRKSTAVSRQRIGKIIPAEMNKQAIIDLLLETAFSTRFVKKDYGENNWGGVEYLHRDPASRRRRRKGKSQN